MCGIAGLLIPRTNGKSFVSKAVLQKMSDKLIHRGPDGAGLWCSDDGKVGLVHRRLSILDLSDSGAQPMSSLCGSYVISFNGEIYNHRDLREVLNKERGPINWRGHSDTETLLECISHWGLNETLSRSFGMFAIAVWDKQAHTLALARDRMGEKPLYFAHDDKRWAFASELASLYAVQEFSTDLNIGSVASQIATGVIPDDAGVYESTRKVRPGTILTVSAATAEMTERPYETFYDLVSQGRKNLFVPKKAQSAENMIEDVLTQVIKSQMISDVPLGSFLSGGVDSSLVTALMQVNSDQLVKTFSIGFSDASYDESAHAEKVAQYLGTEHLSFRICEEDALEVIPELSKIYGEPFADSSQIPTLILCREASKHVTVVLTGDGGDEIFGGYNRHVLVPKFWKQLSRLSFFAKGGSMLLERLLFSQSDKYIRTAAKIVGLSPSVVRKGARFGEVIGKSQSLEDMYFGLTRHCDEPEKFLRNGVLPKQSNTSYQINDLKPAERLMVLDSVKYLPSDILVKVDRASMSASLETRSPFLDARTVRAAWGLDLSSRIRNGKGKTVLRDILHKHIPKNIIERPKQGFAVPIDTWLRGPLRAWVEDLICYDKIEQYGVMSFNPVHDLWTEHLSQRRNHGHLLWCILMLQQWLEQHTDF